MTPELANETRSMLTVPPDAVVVSDTSFVASDPDEIIQSNHAYVNALLDDYVPPDEVAPDAMRSYFVDLYLTQVVEGGYEQFIRVSGWHSVCILAIREGLKAMGAQRHLALFEEAARCFEAGLPIHLEDRFNEIAVQENLPALHAEWLRHLPHLVVLPIDHMRTEAIRRSNEVPAHRLPREVQLIRELCTKAGHRYLHLYIDKFTDHARFVGVWHFITDQGSYTMIQKDGKALMQRQDITICEIEAPVD